MKHKGSGAYAPAALFVLNNQRGDIHGTTNSVD